MPGLAGIAEVGAGQTHSCARLDDGTVSCWGDREFVGLDASVMSPTPVPGLMGVTRLYGGASGFCAVIGSEARLWCCGRTSGNAATGTATAYRPVEVSW